MVQELVELVPTLGLPQVANLLQILWVELEFQEREKAEMLVYWELVFQVLMEQSPAQLVHLEHVKAAQP